MIQFEITDSFLAIGIFGAIVLFLSPWLILAWCLSRGRMIQLLESIDESLKMLPAVRERRVWLMQHAEEKAPITHGVMN